MNHTGLSFNLALLAAIAVSVVVGVFIATRLRRLDELDEIAERHRAWSKLDLQPGEVPPCIRELDPHGPFDWSRLTDL